MMNMRDGEIKANKLAETYQQFNSNTCAYEMKFNQSYNVKCTPIWYSNVGGDQYGDPLLLTLPLTKDLDTGPTAQEETAIDGLKSTIISKSVYPWMAKMRHTLLDASDYYVTQFKSLSQAASASIVVCASPELISPYGYILGVNDNGEQTITSLYDNGLPDRYTWSEEHGYFVVNGVFTNFILLEPGAQLLLRSCRSEENNYLYWYVENGDDFIEVPLKVALQLNHAFNSSTGKVEKLSSPQWQPLHHDNWAGYSENKERAFVSKSLGLLYEKYKTSNSFNTDLYIDVFTSDNNYTSGTDWLWEEGIAYISISGESESGLAGWDFSN